MVIITCPSIATDVPSIETRTDQRDLEALIEKSTAEIRSDILCSINNLKANIYERRSSVIESELKAKEKFAEMDIESNKLQRKVNRADVICTFWNTHGH